MTGKLDDYDLGHHGPEVILNNAGERWEAGVKLQTGKNEIVSYKLSAPSQTAIMALIAMTLRLRGRD